MARELKDPTPEILWKYRKWDDNGHARAIIESSELYYATSDQLNDPLDFHWRDKYPTDPTELFRFARAYCKKYFPVDTDNEFVEVVAEVIGLIKNAMRDSVDGHMWTDAELKLGVLSLSEACDDFLLWSHYAAGHKGICIGIRTDRVKGDGKVITFRKCRYLDEPMTMDAWAYVTDKIEPLLDAICCKASRWSYEREWRSAATPGLRRFPGCVDRIVLGVNVDEKTKAEVLDSVKESGQPIRIFQAKPHPWLYQLKIEPVTP